MATQLIQVSKVIWCVRRPSYLTCSYIVDSAEGVVLVDAGMDSTGGDILNALKQLSISTSRVRAILLTHWHNDHAAGGQVLKEVSSAEVLYHKLESPFLTRRTAQGGWRGCVSDAIPEIGPLVLFKGLLGEAIPQAVEATRFIEDGELLLNSFQVIATPGHTQGHLSFYYHPEKALFAGDALAVVNGQVRFMSRPVTPDKEQARLSVAKCLEREITLLCPGHREVLTENTQKECRRLADYNQAGKPWPLFG